MAPGYAVAFVAGVAAVMSIHAEMKPWQKAAWMALIGVLLVIETRAISADRIASNESAHAARVKQDEKFSEVLKTQKEQFQKIADGLSEAIAKSDSQFTATMERSNRIFGKGQSYSYTRQHSKRNPCER
jgi:GTP cyclohydrolase II